MQFGATPAKSSPLMPASCRQALPSPTLLQKNMSPDSLLKIQLLEKYPVLMTKEKVAEALGIAIHNIPPLTRAGLLKPLGRPGRYCVKLYSRDALAQQLADAAWLDKVAATIHRHWRSKNLRRRARSAECPLARLNRDPDLAQTRMRPGESLAQQQPARQRNGGLNSAMPIKRPPSHVQSTASESQTAGGIDQI